VADGSGSRIVDLQGSSKGTSIPALIRSYNVNRAGICIPSPNKAGIYSSNARR
jgi:hypothetical protein